MRASDPAAAESVLVRMFLILVSFGLFCGFVGYLTRVAVSRRLRVPELRPLLAPALVAGLTVAAWSADLPIVVRWQLSEHSFEDAARQMRDGVDPRRFDGHRLGLYRVDDSGTPTSSIRRDATGIYFATGPAGGYCSSGAGFAQITDAPAGGELHHLNGDWYWFCIDSGGRDAVVPDRPVGGWR